ncbi:MAG: hypothetical protein QOC81_2793 [Thermoanaerobaculia bacterium]|jgi:hypothetical protein|nr:hypothetical protein [Thermoanaerobaculia bacterium]
MTPSPRKLLGRNVRMMSRESVYETADAIEVESREGYEVTRKRVLYEEVLLVTIHRAVGVPFVVSTALAAALFGSIALILLSLKLESGAITFGVFALPFLLACIFRLVMKVDSVTVFGKRSKAVMRFTVRKRRAREVYGRICARAVEVQRAMVPREPEPIAVDEPPLPPDVSAP